MTKVLKLIHDWLGFFLSLIMLIVLFSGIYLGAIDLIDRLDDKGQKYASLTHEQQAKAVAYAFEQLPDTRGVRLPTEQTPFIEVYSRNQSVYLTNELTVIETVKKVENPVYRFMMILHRHLQLGDFGQALNAWSALLCTIIMFIGLYLWWLIRTGFRLKQTLPKNTKNSSLIKSHIQLGVIFSIPLIIMAFSGFYLTYGVRSGPGSAPQQLNQIVGAENDWQSQVAQALTIWPKAQLVSVSKPRPRRGQTPPKGQALVYQLSFNENADVWLQQTDAIKVNRQTAELVSVVTFADKSFANQVLYLARFLHDGSRMPTSYLLILILSSIVGIFMVLFSLVTFVRKHFFNKSKVQVSQTEPIING